MVFDDTELAKMENCGLKILLSVWERKIWVKENRAFLSKLKWVGNSNGPTG